MRWRDEGEAKRSSHFMSGTPLSIQTERPISKLQSCGEHADAEPKRELICSLWCKLCAWQHAMAPQNVLTHAEKTEKLVNKVEELITDINRTDLLWAAPRKSSRCCPSRILKHIKFCKTISWSVIINYVERKKNEPKRNYNKTKSAAFVESRP